MDVCEWESSVDHEWSSQFLVGLYIENIERAISVDIGWGFFYSFLF